jgi:purine-binding chemotaxis protein CheW
VGQGSALVGGGEAPAPVVRGTAVESTPDDVPDWAQAPFQALLFQVAGLTLAVPLAKLNGVTPWDADALRPTPGHSERFLGLLPHHGRNVKVVDTARVVVPPERLLVSSEAHGARFSRVVVVGGGEWGLAADSVNEVVELAAEGVKWRSTAGRRPWLAGTVVSQMCALLDVDALVELMSRGDP